MTPLNALIGLGLALLIGGSPRPATAAKPDGEALFLARCASCHRGNGQGLSRVFPPLAGSEFVNGPAARPIRIVLTGMTGPVTVQGQPYDYVMPALAERMTDEEIAAALSYVRTSWGNHAGAVTVAQVKALRK